VIPSVAYVKDLKDFFLRILVSGCGGGVVQVVEGVGLVGILVVVAEGVDELFSELTADETDR
jgi:hypothetical protein